MSKDTPHKTNSEIAASLVALLSKMNSGDRARIRRGQHCSAFWRAWTAAGLGDTDGPRADHWAHFIKSLALFIGTRSGETATFISTDRLGKNMADAAIKEARFERLIVAPLEMRQILLDRAVLVMARNIPAINVYDLCDLYLFEEPKRLRAICSSYYRSIS
jgi:hypothetical protein